VANGKPVSRYLRSFLLTRPKRSRCAYFSSIAKYMMQTRCICVHRSTNDSKARDGVSCKNASCCSMDDSLVFLKRPLLWKQDALFSIPVYLPIVSKNSRNARSTPQKYWIQTASCRHECKHDGKKSLCWYLAWARLFCLPSAAERVLTRLLTLLRGGFLPRSWSKSKRNGASNSADFRSLHRFHAGATGQYR